MALKLPRPGRKKGSSGGASERRGDGANPLLAAGGEIVAIAREMLRIPAELALRLAERLGLVILAAWRFVRPVLVAALALGRRVLEWAEREVTPALGIAVVALVAAGLLGATQFVDYRDVQAGVPAYEGVENVAPPPVVDGTAEKTGSAHLYVLVVVAVAAAVVVVLSMLGRWRLARSLVVLGLVTVAVAVFIDAPSGLDEGQVADSFVGAEARLLGAFWVEIFAGVVIAVCGPLLALNLRPARAGVHGEARSRRRSRKLLPRVGRSRVQGARS